jgi:hypothetical protein
MNVLEIIILKSPSIGYGLHGIPSLFKESLRNHKGKIDDWEEEFMVIVLRNNYHTIRWWMY